MEPTIYKPSIYKGAGIYKAGAEGGGGDIDDINEYFENVYIYWNNQYTSYPVFTPNADFSNENLYILNKLYCPSKYDGEFAFCAQNGTDYTQAKIRVLLGSGWLQNGASGSSVAIPEFAAGEMVLEIEGNVFKFNGIAYTGNYAPYTIKGIWPIPCSQGNYPYAPYNKMAFKELLFKDKITNKVYAHYYGVKRKSDNKLGVLEIVNGSFYQSNNFAKYNV